MKKICIKIFMFLALVAPFSQLNAKDVKADAPKQAVKETKVEIRERLSKNTTENKYGDLTIKLPLMKNVKSPTNKYLPKNLGQLVLYIFPDIDLEDMYKVMPSGDSPSIVLTINSIDRFLGARNAHLREAKYSQGSFRLLLDDGLPLFAYLRYDEDSFGKIVKRCVARPKLSEAKPKKTAKPETPSEADAQAETQSAMKEWLKILKKDYQKKFYNADNVSFGALIAGYNKETREYLVVSTSFGSFWILESELKASATYLYQLRF